MTSQVLCKLIALIFLIGLNCCIDNFKNKQIVLFEEVPSEYSGVTFENNLLFDQSFNIYTYRNFYNGGGVAIGDINNDGLVDIYLTSNQGKNVLYLNKGNFVFVDITESSGVGGTRAWSTGVSMADVNGDGLLDIYVCNSGDVAGDNKENELFINNGDLTFTERAKEFHVDDKGFTTHAAFFDYDGDGDLDLYLLNNSYQAIGSFNLQKSERPVRDVLGGDKLLRNDNGYFTDVSVEAGIYGSVIGFGLGITVGDVNRDGWMDIYVSNDFFERDYLYINNGNATFTESLTQQMKSISAASMGADLADINNDGYPEIFVTDMLPNEYSRIKTVTTFDNWDRYQYSVTNDYFHQFTRNTLQLNNGNGSFSEVGRMVGVEATDWSWGALMFDMDNDGYKDIFVANGIYQDLTDQDYLQYISSEEVVKSIVTENSVNYKKLVDLIPSTPISNFAFQNQKNLEFKNLAKEWGLAKPSFSNGSAYGDLDNDGDLDLVINNVNAKATVYRNNSNIIHPENSYLKFELLGEDSNTLAIGTAITIKHNGLIYYTEQMPNRGFQSSVDPRPLLGLGNVTNVDSVVIRWPNGKITELFNQPTNQVIRLSQSESSQPENKQKENHTTDLSPLFKQLSIPGLDFKHDESEFVDFDRDKLLFNSISTEGPRMSIGDVNGDGLDDVFIGGAKNSPAQLFIQNKNRTFSKVLQAAFEKDKLSEDMASIFFDADGDGDLDLYVCSGSNEFSTSSEALIDRLYLNDGRGHFTRSSQILPTSRYESTSVVCANDFDNDGDLDLFVGVRSHPFLYGLAVNGYILKNDGQGRFSDVTATVAPSLLNVGMITDAAWTDIDNDGDADLVIIGDYMPITVLRNESGSLKQLSGTSFEGSNGWWNRLVTADVDGDGDIDLIVGNHGLNSRFKASKQKPITTFINDFDKNGTTEQILCMYYDNELFPVSLRHDLVAQLPYLKKKYLKYENFKDQTINDIFSKTELDAGKTLYAYELRSGVFINNGSGLFSWQPFPEEAQISPVYSILVDDFDKDGYSDILLGGNLYLAKPEVGRYDASYGTFLKGTGNGKFSAVRNRTSGLQIQGEVRELKRIKVGGDYFILVARNNDECLVIGENLFD